MAEGFSQPLTDIRSQAPDMMMFPDPFEFLLNVQHALKRLRGSTWAESQPSR